MSIITNPIETIKNQALKIWATKEFAERLAQTRTTWFLHMMYCFMIITVLETFMVIIVNDLFTLHNFYSHGTNWIVSTIEEIYYNIHPIVEVAILFFWFSPKIVRTTLSISKAYSNKEKAFFEWIEFKIKRRFPSFKTTAQRARERELNPRKKGKLKIKYDGFMDKRNDVERLIIRGTLWAIYCVFLASVILMMLGAFNDFFNVLMDIDEEVQVVEDVIITDIQEAPSRPDGMPPSTIFDVFINKPDTVMP